MYMYAMTYSMQRNSMIFGRLIKLKIASDNLIKTNDRLTLHMLATYR